MIENHGGAVSDWPCPTCGGAPPDGTAARRVCRCGLLWNWGARPSKAEWEMIRHLLACRSDGRCERCGRKVDRSSGVTGGTVHHRDPRGMGGSSDPAVNDLCNMLLLCGGKLGGVLGCHGDTEESRERAYRQGWLVHDGTDPATVPVVLAGRRRVLLPRDLLEYEPPADGILWDLERKAHPLSNPLEEAS